MRRCARPGTRCWCQVGEGLSTAQPGGRGRQFAGDGGKTNSSRGRGVQDTPHERRHWLLWETFIASEAKQSNAFDSVMPGRCAASNPESRDSGSGAAHHPGMTGASFVAPLLTMTLTADAPSRPRSAPRPRVFQTFRPSSDRGRGECRVPGAPAALKYAHRCSQRGTGITRHSRTRWFYGLWRTPPHVLPYASTPVVLRAGHPSRRAILPGTPPRARRCRVHRIPSQRS
jgi:hypothetical protein